MRSAAFAHRCASDYSHRKRWVLERLAQLTSIFSIEICARWRPWGQIYFSGGGVTSKPQRRVYFLSLGKLLGLEVGSGSAAWSMHDAFSDALLDLKDEGF
jgi:hypothetical protein